MDFINIPILLFTVLLSISILTSLVSARAGVPLILLFLCIGLIAGSGVFPFLIELQRPRIAFFIGSVALALILFDSGFQTSMKSYRKAARASILLATVGVGLSALFLAPIAKFVLNLDWLQAALLVSIISSTDAAAVFFLLRSQGIALKEKVQSTLEIESGANDPMAIFLTIGFIMVIQTISMGLEPDKSLFIARFFAQLFIGGGCGFLLFNIMRFCVNRVRFERALYPIFVLGLAMMGFAVTNMLGGSGYLAVYIAGLLLGNSHIQARSPILRFQQTISWLSQILMFATLGLFANWSELQKVILPAFLIGTGLTFIARPAMVWLLLGLSKKYTVGEKMFMSFVGLRGATSILLALAPLVYEIPNAALFFNVIFVMVLYSLAFQGLLIPLAAKWCHVIEYKKHHPATRTEVDLPGLENSSLILYELTEKSPVVRGQKIPRWAQPTLVIRQGVLYQKALVSQFRAGDKVYVFAPSDRRLPLLDQLFGSEEHADLLGVLGDFPIAPRTTFGELCHMYGVKIQKSLEHKTVAELLTAEFPDADIGDRLSLDSIELVVRGVQDGVPTEIGIDIDPSRRKSSFYARTRFMHFLNGK